MSFDFLESNEADNVQVTDNALLSLPDSDWTIAGWIKLDDNVGTDFQYFFSHGAFAATESINCWIGEVDSSDANDWKIRTGDVVLTSTGVGSSTAWQHIIMSRSGTTLSAYVDGGSSTASNTLTNAVNPVTNLWFGMRAVSPDLRWFGGNMAEWAKWDRALGAGERDALALGYSPSFFPNSLIWYIPMIREYDEYYNALTVTNNGSTVNVHPPMIYPSAQIIPFPAAAGGGGPVSISSLQHALQFNRRKR